MSFVFTQFKCQTVLFDPQIGPYQVLPLRVRVNLGAMAMKSYSASPKIALLEPLQRCSQSILQPQPTGLSTF